MDKIDLLTDEFQVARLHQRQLKVTMDLPVRLVTGDQVVDVIPLPTKKDQKIEDCITRKLRPLVPLVYPTLAEIHDFFLNAKRGDLVTPTELAEIFHCSKRTIGRLQENKLIKAHQLLHSLTLFKLSELPEALIVV